MTAQICLTHWMMVSGTPETVTARSVELGSRSPATCTCAPVLWGGQREMLGSLSYSPLGLSTSHLACPLLSPQGPLQDPQVDAPLLHHFPWTLRDRGSPGAEGSVPSRGKGEPAPRAPSALPPGSPGS